MKTAPILLFFALCELALAAWTGSYLWADIGLSTGLLSIAMWLNRPEILGKTPDGLFPLWSLVIFWPWHLLCRVVARLISHKDEPFTQICPGWWVGGWPSQTAHFERWPAVLDLTAELPKRCDARQYLTIAVWDHSAPSDEQLERALTWISAQRAAQRDVLIHCAAGRGRSVTVLVAALVEARLHPSWQEALSAIKSRRPSVRLHPEQIALLERWQAKRVAK